jgi:hypothetical protein
MQDVEIHVIAYSQTTQPTQECRGFIVDPRDGARILYPRYGLCFDNEKRSWRKKTNSELKYGYITWVKDKIALSIDGISRYRNTGFGDTIYCNGTILCKTPNTVVGITKFNDLLVAITLSGGSVLGASYRRFSYTYTNDNAYDASSNPNGWKSSSISTPVFSNGDLRQPIHFNRDGNAGVGIYWDLALLDSASWDTAEKVVRLTLSGDISSLSVTATFSSAQTGLGQQNCTNQHTATDNWAGERGYFKENENESGSEYDLRLTPDPYYGYGSGNYSGSCTTAAITKIKAIDFAGNTEKLATVFLPEQLRLTDSDGGSTGILSETFLVHYVESGNYVTSCNGTSASEAANIGYSDYAENDEAYITIGDETFTTYKQSYAYSVSGARSVLCYHTYGASDGNCLAEGDCFENESCDAGLSTHNDVAKAVLDFDLRCGAILYVKGFYNNTNDTASSEIWIKLPNNTEELLYAAEKGIAYAGKTQRTDVEGCDPPNWFALWYADITGRRGDPDYAPNYSLSQSGTEDTDAPTTAAMWADRLLPAIGPRTFERTEITGHRTNLYLSRISNCIFRCNQDVFGNWLVSVYLSFSFDSAPTQILKVSKTFLTRYDGDPSEKITPIVAMYPHYVNLGVL